MGHSLLITGRRNIKMMKTFAIALLAAVAFAEPEAKPKADADPYLLYGGYGYGLGHLGYRGYYGHALGYAGYYGYPYAHHGLAYYGKRSADAEPRADADPLPSLWRIWIWTPWIPWILWIPLCPWICLLGISYNHQSLILLQKMDKTTINVFFFSDNIFSARSHFEFFSRKQRESKYKEIKNKMKYILQKKKKKKKKKKKFSKKKKKKKKKK